jgi:hypothetical protein
MHTLNVGTSHGKCIVDRFNRKMTPKVHSISSRDSQGWFNLAQPALLSKSFYKSLVDRTTHGIFWGPIQDEIRGAIAYLIEFSMHFILLTTTCT